MHSRPFILIGLTAFSMLGGNVLAQPVFTGLEFGGGTTEALRVSGDGLTVTGSFNMNVQVPDLGHFVWTSANGMRRLNAVVGLPFGQAGTACNGIGADGQASVTSLRSASP